ncbi:MAG TPA: solute-binding protein [Desulfuromonadales bacterium]|nr:solute-binding protein [Desulfuromonadales bacterium]
MYYLVAMLLFTPGICRATETVTVNGSGSALDMMKPLIAAFHKSNKNIHVVMEKPLGSSGAVKALLAGALDLVLSSKPLKPEEVAKGARQQVYGVTPLIIIAEKNVRKSDITTQELEDIYRGKMTAWPNGETIRLVMRPNEDVDSKLLSKLSPGMVTAMNTARSRSGMVIAVTDPEAYHTVAKTAGGLGATGMTSIIVEKPPVTLLSLNGIKASPKTLVGGSYPLSKEISIVTGPKTTSAANTLIKFMLSPQGRALATANGVHVTFGAAAHQ